MSETTHYLLALYRLTGGHDDPVPPSDVADAVERSPAATTEMLQRLDERGIVDHEPYEGTILTAEGEDTARDLHQTYVTLTRFFRDVLELENYEDEALALAGTVSPVVIDRLTETLLEDADAAPTELWLESD